MYPFHEKMLKQTQDFAVASLLVLTNKTSSQLGIRSLNHLNYLDLKYSISLSIDTSYFLPC